MGSLTIDDLPDATSPATTAPKRRKLTIDDLPDRAEPPVRYADARPDHVEGIGGALAQGATFGYGDEIAAWLDSGAGQVAEGIGLIDRGLTYEESLANIRGRVGAYKESAPVTSTVAELGGAIAGGPGRLAVGLGTRAVAAGRTAFGLAPKAAPVLSAAVGAVPTGAAYRAGTADPDSASGSPLMIWDAASRRLSAATDPSGVALDLALGAGGAKAGQLIGKAVDGVSETIAKYGSGPRAARTVLVRKLGEDDLTVGAVRDALSPAIKGRTPDDLAVAMEAMARSPSRAAAGRDLAPRLGVTPSAATSVIARTLERYPMKGTPLTLAEVPSVLRADRVLAGLDDVAKAAEAKAARAAARAAANPSPKLATVALKARTAADGAAADVTDEVLTAFDDTATRQVVDYLAQSAGKAGARVRTAVTGRQKAARARMIRGLVADFGGKNLDELAEELDDLLVRQGRTAYTAAYAAEQPVKQALDDVVSRWYVSAVGGRGGEVSSAVRGALEEFRKTLTVQGQLPVVTTIDTLQEAVDARAVLRGMVERYGNTSSASGNRAVAAQLSRLYDDITDALTVTNPKWRVANDIWGDARNGQKAVELGLDLPLKGSARAQRRALAEFRKLPPVQRDRAAVAFMQRLSSMLTDAGDTHDLTKFFRSGSARAMLREVFGEDVARTMIRRLRDETLASSTAGMTGNSRTAMRLGLREELAAPADVVGAAGLMSAGGLRDAALRMTRDRLLAMRDAPLAQMLLTDAGDPVAMLPLLRDLERHAGRMKAARSGAGAARGVAIGRTAPLVPYAADDRPRRWNAETGRLE